MITDTKTSILTSKTAKYSILSLASAAGGVLCGLIGIGGGLILLPAFALTCRDRLSDKSDIFACTLLSVIPMSVLSAARYFKSGCIDLSQSLVLIIPAILGGIAGSIMLGRINTKILRLILAAIMMWSGISMIFG